MSTAARLGLALAALAVACVCIFIAVAKPFATEKPVKEALSPEAAHYLERSMWALNKATVVYQNGDTARARHLYKSIGRFPIMSDTDFAVSVPYLAYANNVRYCMVDDGSCTLKQLEASRAKAEAAIAAYK
jgi:hypothetical protein